MNKDDSSGKIIIWGSSSLALYVYEKIYEKYNVWICDNNRVALDKLENVHKIEGSRLNEIVDRRKDVVLISAKSAKNCYSILNQIENMDIENIAFIKPRVEKYCLPFDIENDDEVVWYCRNGKKNRIFPRIEINVIDGCNLKCEGCSHFSSLYDEGSKCTLDSFKRDLTRLNEIGKLVRLRLLGGEPLLLDNIGEYAATARKIFPYTDIEIITNGLLITKVSVDNWKLIRDSDVCIGISPYKPTLAIKDKIESVLENNGVQFAYEGDCFDKFAKLVTLDGVHDGYKSSEGCLSAGCTFVRNGRIYKCPVEGTIGDFSQYYSLKNPIAYDGISLYEKDDDLLYEKIKNIALNPVGMCSYCSEKLQYFDWRVNSHPVLEDWLYINS
jgi:hypothetical protein